jgi:hypothetical protein
MKGRILKGRNSGRTLNDLGGNRNSATEPHDAVTEPADFRKKLPKGLRWLGKISGDDGILR